MDILNSSDVEIVEVWEWTPYVRKFEPEGWILTQAGGITLAVPEIMMVILDRIE